MQEAAAVQPWLVWGILAAVLMLGAWMRMGSYLYWLGAAAILALVEAAAGCRLAIQIATFAAASSVPALLQRAVSSRRRAGGRGAQRPPGC
ncbi:MAG: hypothetical protein PHN82_07950 [bacterium]|nr:hypothetical protein [bacterium]